jgi:hypothetical protein
MKFASKELEDACRKADAKIISLALPEEAQDSHFAEPAWPVLHDGAYYGLAGEIVRSIEPHSEADPVAILLQFLAAFGNAVGICPITKLRATSTGPNCSSSHRVRPRRGAREQPSGASANLWRSRTRIGSATTSKAASRRAKA